MMYDTKLISARVDKRTLDKIDTLAQRNIYWNRNCIINKLLWVVMNHFDEQDIFEMMKALPSDKFTGTAKYMGYFDVPTNK